MTTTPTPPETVTTRKGSALGALALLSSALGAAGCATIGVLSTVVNPELMVGLALTATLSLTGFVLGVAAFFFAPKGTLRGGAIAATFLGAAFGAIQGAVVVGALVQYLPIKRQVVPMVETILVEGRSVDPAPAIALLGEGAQDADIVGFLRVIDGSVGTVSGVRVELATLSRAGSTVSAYQPRADADQNIVLPKPVELLTGTDETLLLGVWLDEEALKTEQVLVSDLIAFLPNGTLLCLRDDGPAWTLAGNFDAPVRLP